MTAVAPSQVFSKSSFFATTSWEVKMGENERRQVDSPGQGASNDTSLMKIGAQTAKKRGWLQEIGLKFENFDPCSAAMPIFAIDIAKSGQKRPFF